MQDQSTWDGTTARLDYSILGYSHHFPVNGCSAIHLYSHDTGKYPAQAAVMRLFEGAECPLLKSLYMGKAAHTRTCRVRSSSMEKQKSPDFKRLLPLEIRAPVYENSKVCCMQAKTPQTWHVWGV